MTPPVWSRLDKYNDLHYSCSDMQYLQQGSQQLSSYGTQRIKVCYISARGIVSRGVAWCKVYEGALPKNKKIKIVDKQILIFFFFFPVNGELKNLVGNVLNDHRLKFDKK
jgi:hypothetical protein